MFPDDTRDVLDGGLLALIEEDDVSVNDITNLPTKTYCKDEKSELHSCSEPTISLRTLW